MRKHLLRQGMMYLMLISAISVCADNEESQTQEKKLYSTTFTEWSDASASTTESTVTEKTRYSHENLSFSLYDTQICSTNQNTSKFPNWTGGYLMAAKSADPYIKTSALASITRVHFIHGATGSNRGWKLEVKGDGDTDWVTVSSTVANPATGCDVSVDVNRTNCQLRFTNLNASQNAYLFQLDIYGNVDQGNTPTLTSFSANGKTYEADSLFEENANGIYEASIEISKKEEMISDSNPLSDISTDQGQATVDYETTGMGKEQKTVATLIVKNEQDSTVYLLNIAYKPDYTLSFFDANGTTLLGTQSVEKDAPIDSFAVDEAKVTVAPGEKFRGWVAAASGGKKYAVTDCVVSDLNLFALVTPIETANDTARYEYDLADPYFYAEDHEALITSGRGAFHDTTHGWVFKAGDQIKVLMGGRGYVKLGLCQYSGSSTITLSDPKGNIVASVEGKATTDGSTAILQYDGSKGGDTLTLTFSAVDYLHNLAIVNLKEVPYTQEGAWYTIKAGNVNSLLTTLEVVNGQNTGSDAPRAYIFLPNGTYDLGNRCLTPISGNHISLIGQSMDSTLIMNTPTAEGIGITATLYNTGNGLYLQDLTLRNAYPFNGSTGRAVCLQDKGDSTICKNVKLLSYQDTYYSNNNNGHYYWETSDLHGIVDFLCGGGDALYEQCTLTIEAGKNAYITAPYTDGTKYGYVFDGCKIVDLGDDTFYLGRSWGGTANCTYLNTTFDQQAQANIAKTRWLPAGMNVIAQNFYEYHSMDENGEVISPDENIVTFTLNNTQNTYNTILGADSAATFTSARIFGTWAPEEKTVQVSAPALTLSEGKLKWSSAEGAIAYAVFNDGKFMGLTTSTAFSLPSAPTGTYTLRAANSMGGFGTGQSIATGIRNTQVQLSETGVTLYYSPAGIQIPGPRKGINIQVSTLDNGTRNATKFIRK